MLSEIQQKVARLKYGFLLYISGTENSHMAPGCGQVTWESYCNYVMMCSFLWIQQPFLPLYLFCLGAAAAFKLLSVPNRGTKERNTFEESHVAKQEQQ